MEAVTAATLLAGRPPKKCQFPVAMASDPKLANGSLGELGAGRVAGVVVGHLGRLRNFLGTDNTNAGSC